MPSSTLAVTALVQEAWGSESDRERRVLWDVTTSHVGPKKYHQLATVTKEADSRTESKPGFTSGGRWGGQYRVGVEAPIPGCQMDPRTYVSHRNRANIVQQL